MMFPFSRFRTRIARGQSLTEVGTTIALVALVALVSLGLLSVAVDSVFSNINSALGSAPGVIPAPPPAPRPLDYPETVLADPNLLGFWQMQEASGASAALDSSNGHHNAVIYNATSDAAGPFAGSSAFSFNGSNAYLDTFALPAYSTISFEAWVKPSTTNGRLPIWNDRNGDSGPGIGTNFMVGPTITSGGNGLSFEDDGGGTAWGGGYYQPAR